MGFFGNLFDMLFGMKVYDNCTKQEEMTEEEEEETLLYLNMQMDKKLENMEKKKDKWLFFFYLILKIGFICDILVGEKRINYDL